MSLIALALRSDRFKLITKLFVYRVVFSYCRSFLYRARSIFDIYHPRPLFRSQEPPGSTARQASPEGYFASPPRHGVGITRLDNRASFLNAKCNIFYSVKVSCPKISGFPDVRTIVLGSLKIQLA
ncbi:hypothetical protein KM043_006625 [Ampulex compressa]|nr:hypothetical protein KM043_006625 [Ampulex compressa]